MSAQSPVCVLCVLVGIPAAGKSTLSRTLQAAAHEGSGISALGGKTATVRCVRFDDDLDAALTENGSEFDVEKWRASRAESLARVRTALDQFGSSPTPTSLVRVVIADDNAQYTSMRYHLFRAARDAACAFATVFVDVSVEDAVKRNALRISNERVPEATIRRMATQLEPPDGSKHTWEEHSVTIDGASIDACVDAVWRVLRAAFEAGVPPKSATAEEHKERQLKARAVTADSMAHQLDLALRRIVGTVLKSHAVQALDRPHRAIVSGVLSRVRRSVQGKKSLANINSAMNTFCAEFRHAFSEMGNSSLSAEEVSTLCSLLEEQARFTAATPIVA